MNFSGYNSGNCGCNCPKAQPTYQQCCQVVHTCNVEEVPHHINYHTHGNSKRGYIKSIFNFLINHIKLLY